VIRGDIEVVKCIVGEQKIIPVEALYLIKGYEVETEIEANYIKNFEAIKVETSPMNMVELSSVFNNYKMFKFLVNNLNLKHKRDLCQQKEEKKIRQ
jgi:hypothetical protein